MNKTTASDSALIQPRLLVAIALGCAGVLLAGASVADTAAPHAPVDETSGVVVTAARANAAPAESTERPRIPAAPAEFTAWLEQRMRIGSARRGTGTSPSAAIAPVGPASTAVAGNWSLVPTPNIVGGVTTNDLFDVTCVSESDCWAVGRYAAGSVRQTLTLHWDGSTWSIVPSPSSSPTQSNVLNAVTCTASNDCWAVGYYFAGPGFNQTLALHWDGTSWKRVQSANVSPTEDNVLFGISCVAANDCWAVGGYRLPAPSIGPQRTLTQHWDGTSWTIVPSPVGLGTLNTLFTDVTCTSTSDCWAVGTYTNDVAAQTFIARWNGSIWSTVLSPNTSVAGDNVLTSVTCASDADCWAVGYHVALAGPILTLTLHWDGLTWSLVPSPNPNPTQENFLYGVTCASSADCWAVGLTFLGQDYETVIQRWNGSSWSLVASPNIAGAAQNFLYGVVCTSGSDCWAAGEYTVNGTPQTMTQQWNGTTWEVVESPNHRQARLNHISEVVCNSETDCWAVGFANKNSAAGPAQTLYLRWNGVTWSIVASPDGNPTQTNLLTAVTCTSETDCWAVGYYIAGSTPQTLTTRWDGAAWSIVPSPNADGTTSNLLSDVTCASASDCWAVGSARAAGVNRTMIQHWDGDSWTIVASPNASAGNNSLAEVTCTSSDDCWAVGTARVDGILRPQIQQWNGSSWSLVASPLTNATDTNVLESISCASAADCWAVGYSLDAEGTRAQTLAQRWDGTAWTIVPTPNRSATEDVFNAVTCTSSSSCWAVGYTIPGEDLNRSETLIQHWDGSAWGVVDSPSPSPMLGNSLSTVTCVTGGDCWALGSSDFSLGVPNTLALRFTAAALPTVAAVVSRKLHGAAGEFDVVLPFTGSPGIECRSGGANAEHTLVFTFASELSSVQAAAVTTGTGIVSNSYIDSSNPRQYVVQLSGVTNAQTITVTLTNVTDTSSATSASLSATMAVLLGDTSANGVVNATDVSQIKAHSGQQVSAATFRLDVTGEGAINASDISLVKTQSGAVLP
jgi:hypothetical protein